MTALETPSVVPSSSYNAGSPDLPFGTSNLSTSPMKIEVSQLSTFASSADPKKNEWQQMPPEVASGDPMDAPVLPMKINHSFQKECQEAEQQLPNEHLAKEFYRARCYKRARTLYEQGQLAMGQSDGFSTWPTSPEAWWPQPDYWATVAGNTGVALEGMVPQAPWMDGWASWAALLQPPGIWEQPVARTATDLDKIPSATCEEASVEGAAGSSADSTDVGCAISGCTSEDECSSSPNPMSDSPPMKPVALQECSDGVSAGKELLALLKPEATLLTNETSGEAEGGAKSISSDGVVPPAPTGLPPTPLVLVAPPGLPLPPGMATIHGGVMPPPALDILADDDIDAPPGLPSSHSSGSEADTSDTDTRRVAKDDCWTTWLPDASSDASDIEVAPSPKAPATIAVATEDPMPKAPPAMEAPEATKAPVTKAPLKEAQVMTKFPVATKASVTKVPVTEAPVAIKTPVTTKAPVTEVATKSRMTKVPVTKAPARKPPTTKAPLTKDPVAKKLAVKATTTKVVPERKGTPPPSMTDMAFTGGAKTESKSTESPKGKTLLQLLVLGVIALLVAVMASQSQHLFRSNRLDGGRATNMLMPATSHSWVLSSPKDACAHLRDRQVATVAKNVDIELARATAVASSLKSKLKKVKQALKKQGKMKRSP